MKTVKFIVAITFFSFFIQLSDAQNIIGLWKVKKVSIGKKSKTPVAKWFKINKDKTYQMGNGWLQNGEGTWTFDKKAQTYLPQAINDIKDEFGAFKVSFDNEKMIWKRREEGAEVTIALEKIKELPKSTADKARGLWDLESVTKDGKNILTEIDPKSKYFASMRWDRIFILENTRKGKLTGYWHMNGHRPELVLMYHDNTIELESWQVSFDNKKMIWEGKSDNKKGVKMIFTRLDTFPK